MNFASSWNAIEETTGASSREDPEIADLKDGTYTVEITDFSFFAAKSGRSAGKQFSKFTLLVRQGLRKGAYVEKFSRASDVGLEILKKDLRRITGRWASPEEVYNEERNVTGPIRAELVGAILEVQKKTSKPDGNGKVYPRFLFTRLIRAALGVEAAEDEDDEDDEQDPARDAGEPADLPDKPSGGFLEDPEPVDEDDEDDDDEGEGEDDEDIPF